MKNEKRETSTLVIENVQEIKIGGVTIQVGGGVVEVVGGKVQQPANDTAIAAAKEALEVGTKMSDGSIYAGLTADGKSKIFAMPTDLSITMAFNNAAKAVQTLNSQKALGHDDWQIPNEDALNVLQKSRNEGWLRGTFKAGASGNFDYSRWYWSSTEHRDHPSLAWAVRFSGGGGSWDSKTDFRLSCRPVRLVEACEAPQTASHSPAPR